MCFFFKFKVKEVKFSCLTYKKYERKIKIQTYRQLSFIETMDKNEKLINLNAYFSCFFGCLDVYFDGIFYFKTVTKLNNKTELKKLEIQLSISCQTFEKFLSKQKAHEMFFKNVY